MVRLLRYAFALLLFISILSAASCGGAADRRSRSDAGEPDAATDSGQDAGAATYDAGPSGNGDPRPWGHADPCAAIDCPPDHECVGRSCVPIGAGNGGRGGSSGFGGRGGHGGFTGR